MDEYTIVTGSLFKQLSISNINVSYEDINNGNPYNTTFLVKVISGDFAGISGFEYDIKNFLLFVKDMRDLYNFKINEVELIDICYGSKLKFSLAKTGHITISGTIHGSAMEHSLTFEFTTDQTAIETFYNSLYNDYIIDNKYNCQKR
jgi:hypothetical protein